MNEIIKMKRLEKNMSLEDVGKLVGVGNMRSRYDVCVPATVEKEALELQAIRKKHQGNDNFDFYATSYKTIEIREADHSNF